ncbi:Asp-tRNA(Asn)/Glu-tRNA(Gln) amidotransferase subunit GatC [Balneolaceae bacterium ANBcel3]|nr:Asp-tRNA(Asn)/Glu-tRNA(Gln) amidotransferase subunit GatC [Balneolaceae bacterium ANBcel3]
MPVNLNDVYYMANLARLQLSENEAKELLKDMNDILSYMDLLNQIDSTGIPPMEHVTDTTAGFRPDKAHDPLSHELALKNAPDADTNHFRVPKVID